MRRPRDLFGKVQRKASVLVLHNGTPASLLRITKLLQLIGILASSLVSLAAAGGFT